ncbi:11062_t:CDS:2, partial [Scutellospora calospora]
ELMSLEYGAWSRSAYMYSDISVGSLHGRVDCPASEKASSESFPPENSHIIDTREHSTAIMLLPLACLIGGALAQFGNNGAPARCWKFPDVTYPDGISPNPDAVAGAQSDQNSPPKYPSPWGSGDGDWAEAYKKAIEVVKQLTLEEKVNLTTGSGWQQEQCVGQTGGVPRLGIRGQCLQDSPVASSPSSLLALTSEQLGASAWPMSAAKPWVSRVATKASPCNLDPSQSPQGGRNWEGFSPDPYLTGKLFADSIRGIQSTGVQACAKHYVGNEQEHFRQTPEAQDYGFNITEPGSSNIDDQTLHEVYACQRCLSHVFLQPAQQLASMPEQLPFEPRPQGGARLPGIRRTIRRRRKLLRAQPHHCGTQWHGAAMASWTPYTNGAVHAHVGPTWGTGVVNQHVDVRRKHGALIREIGAASTVLLKNTKGALPLTNTEKLTAVIGEDAGSNPTGPNGCRNHGCDIGTLGVGWGSGQGNFPYLISPDAAIQHEVTSRYGSYEAITNNSAFTQIELLSKRVTEAAGVCLVFANAASGEGFINIENNFGDRKNLTLWQGADAMIANVSANCNNTVLVLHTVGAVEIDQYKDNENITAILWAGLP